MYGQQFFGASLMLSSLVHWAEGEAAPLARPYPEAGFARLSSQSDHEPHLHGRLQGSVEHDTPRSRKVRPGNVELNHRVRGNRYLHEKTSAPRAHILEERETFGRGLTIFPFDYDTSW